MKSPADQNEDFHTKCIASSLSVEALSIMGTNPY